MWEKKNHSNSIGVFLKTAHPVKFLNIVEDVLNIKLEIPNQINAVLNKEKVSVKIKTYEEFKDFITK